MKKTLVFVCAMLLVFGAVGTGGALPVGTVTGIFEGHEYAAVPYTGTWTDVPAAIQTDLGPGWYFADITSASEQNFIAGLLGSFNTGGVDLVWVGGWQNLNTNNWEWYATGELFTYTNWANDAYPEPNNSGGDEHYLALDKRGEPLNRDWTWNDANFTGSYNEQSLVRGYVAENAPVPEPATMLLLGSGLIGIGVFARKRFKK